MEAINALMDLSDQEIIKRIIEGEKMLFEILIRRTNAALYRIARCYGFSHEDAEDLMQETHITAFIELAKFEGRSSYKTWISKIMLHKSMYKKKYGHFKREVSSVFIHENDRPMHTAYSAQTEHEISNRELAKALEGSLQHLPLQYRTVFVLREIEGYSVAETAGLLNLTEVNVKVRCRRAKNILQKEIEKIYTRAEIYSFDLKYCDAIVIRIMNLI
jgi:RNA polymerase sigma-70 factor (ECF subfamily)